MESLNFWDNATKKMKPEDRRTLRKYCVFLKQRDHCYETWLSKENAPKVIELGFSLLKVPGTGHEYNTNTDVYWAYKN